MFQLRSDIEQVVGKQPSMLAIPNHVAQLLQPLRDVNIARNEPTGVDQRLCDPAGRLSPAARNDESTNNKYAMTVKKIIEGSSAQCVKRIGNHAILSDRLLGKGHYGKVFLGYELPTAQGSETIATPSSPRQQQPPTEIHQLQQVS